jgi:hypothetical protein
MDVWEYIRRDEVSALQKREEIRRPGIAIIEE